MSRHRKNSQKHHFGRFFLCLGIEKTPKNIILGGFFYFKAYTSTKSKLKKTEFQFPKFFEYPKFQTIQHFGFFSMSRHRKNSQKHHFGCVFFTSRHRKNTFRAFFFLFKLRGPFDTARFGEKFCKSKLKKTEF